MLALKIRVFNMCSIVFSVSAFRWHSKCVFSTRVFAVVLQGTPKELLFSLRFCSVGTQISRFHHVFHNVFQFRALRWHSKLVFPTRLFAEVLQGPPIELFFSLWFCSVGTQDSRFHHVFHNVFQFRALHWHSKIVFPNSSFR